jgi:cellulose synthase/poly-beta-1,6-N-acetylglucosamine synthase-like glycosyltransferase/peptidoglycan/xylan/chitin deacetylase (PgdA/CDA1 family)
MSGHKRQVFQTMSPWRWRKFIWSFRLFLLVVFLMVAFIISDLFIFPKMVSENETYNGILDPGDPLSLGNKHNEEYTELRKKLGKRGTNCCTRPFNKNINLYSTKVFPFHPDSIPGWSKTKGHEKELVLTFDDGPDPKYTPQVLDILKKEKVKAVFFVIGTAVEENINLLKRIKEEGHEVGNHTFTHPDLALVTPKRAELEMRANKRLIESITLHSTKLYRAPFSHDELQSINQEIIPVSFGSREQYFRIDNAIDSRDWENGSNADSIFARTVRSEPLGNIILMHDGGKREETVKALPRIIKHFKSKGYKFVSISRLMDMKRGELNPPLMQGADRYFAYANHVVAHIIFGLQYVLFPFFFVGIVLAIGRMLFMATFAYIQKKKSAREDEKLFFRGTPLVSIIVPAYNEEVNVIRSVHNLLKGDYPNFEIVFVDDGSKDNTYKNVCEEFQNHPKVRLFTKPNGGKASALNFGIDQARGEFLVCMDADTHLRHNAVSELMKYFFDEKVGAVAGNVKVGNEFSVMAKWQSIEYITSQNFDRRAFDYFNCITVIPGAIGGFRKSAMIAAGKFAVDTLAEDCDTTISILRLGYTIKYSSNAVAMTEAPEAVKQFLKQRFRWTFGIMQTFWKHKDACFNPKFKGVGMIALPNFFIFQLVIPVLTPLSDILMIASIATGNGKMILIWYFVFLAIELIGSGLAFRFEKEPLGKLWLMLPQRIIYKYLMWYVLMKSIIKAIKGELIGWGILKRTGNVKLEGESAKAATAV